MILSVGQRRGFFLPADGIITKNKFRNEAMSAYGRVATCGGGSVVGAFMTTFIFLLERIHISRASAERASFHLVAVFLQVDAFGFGAGHSSGCEVDGFMSGVARGMRVSLRERFGFQAEVVVQFVSSANGLVEVFFRSRVVGEGFHEVAHESGVVLGFLVLFVHNRSLVCF